VIRSVARARPNAAPIPRHQAARPPSLAEAFAYCERIAREHFENYPIAKRFVPPHLRPYVWSIYAFCRIADDFADEPRYAARRAEELERWGDDLERACHGEAEHPVFVALAETLERTTIPMTPLRDLLTSYVMDLSVHRYATYAALERYMAHSAHPVGRLTLYVFGYHDAALHNYADALAAALQLTKVCQDLARDLDRDRIYLPEEDLRHFGLTEADLFARRVTPAFRDLMRFQVARARATFERGRPLIDGPHRVGRDLGFVLALAYHAGTSMLDKIEAAGYDVFPRRPQLSAAEKARMIARAAKTRWPSFS
jgi:squalene synthase HpnC